MLFSNFYPFIIVILQTLIQHLRGKIAKREKEIDTVKMFTNKIEEDDGSTKKEKFYDIWFKQILEWLCKICMPAIGLCFVILYWTLGILN